MSFWEDFWESRRRRWSIFREFERLDRMFEDMIREIFSEFPFPEKLVSERELPDGTRIRSVGPIIYGYSVTIGPDGKPIIREFGNIRPKEGLLRAEEYREPLVDVIEGDKVVQVVAELPGVDKSDINLQATEDKLIISVDKDKRKYYKEVDLPAKVDPKSAKANYKNGVLEVTLNKLEAEKKGVKINVE
ncbi:MAG: Hsp20/alpha crystallin family protein [Candidatus Verstraetearchaeota archaeon]|nr:Hsp20/alpha crystallin family protein [Candidatus Verstraetearchaeota archaeon]